MVCLLEAAGAPTRHDRLEPPLIEGLDELAENGRSKAHVPLPFLSLDNRKIPRNLIAFRLRGTCAATFRIRPHTFPGQPCRGGARISLAYRPSHPSRPQRPQRHSQHRLEPACDRVRGSVAVETQRNRVDEAVRGVEDQRHCAAPVGHRESARGDPLVQHPLDLDCTRARCLRALGRSRASASIRRSNTAGSSSSLAR